MRAGERGVGQDVVIDEELGAKSYFQYVWKNKIGSWLAGREQVSKSNKIFLDNLFILF